MASGHPASGRLALALRWTSALTIGVDAIDAQHRELFARVDRLLDAMIRGDRGEAAPLVEFLRGFVVDHFASEERLMAEVGYPTDATAAHRLEHAAFTAALLEIDARLRSEGPTAALVLRLERQVVGWLSDHVYASDVALGRWVRRARGVEARG